MSLQSVLRSFTSQASAAGLSENDYYLKAVAENDVATLTAIRNEATAQGDTATEAVLQGNIDSANEENSLDGAVGITSTTANIVHVRVDGDDTTGDGSIAKPFLTIKKANEEAALAVPTTEFPFVIDIGPGFYEEADDITPTPHTYWVGAGWQGTAIATVSGGPITWEAPDNADDPVRYLFRDLNPITGFDMSRAPGSVEASSIRCFNCNFSFGPITLTGAGQGLDNAEFHDTLATNVITTLNSVFTTFRNSAFGVMAVSQQGVDGIGASTTNMHNTQHRRITLNDTSLVNLFESRFTSQNIVFNGTGGIVNADVTSTPVNATTLNSGATLAQLVRTTRTSQLSTTGNTGMTTSGNWDGGVVPTDLSDGLNKIITNLKLLNGNPIGTATGTILAGGIDTPSISNSTASASTISAYDGVDADENGQNMTIRAGSATQDSGAGIAGTLTLEAGVESDGSNYGAVVVNANTLTTSAIVTLNAAVNISGSITANIDGGTATFKSKDVSSGNSGTTQINTGAAPAGNSASIVLQPGAASGTRGSVEVQDSNLNIFTAGYGLRVKEGANAKQGVATLVAGTVSIPNTSVTANSRIMLTCQDPNGGTPGALYISARVASTSFDVTSTSVADTGIVAYQIFEPA